MAYDKVVDSSVLDAGLKTIADAIREKGGTSENLEFPTAMAEAIASIQTGSGSSGGITLLESGSFTPTDNLMRYNVELTQVPDFFICYAEVPETDKSDAALDGAVCINIPQVAHMIPYKAGRVSNIDFLINWYTAGNHGLLDGYAYISENGTGAIANVVARSGSYTLRRKTYKWESYRLWE